MNSGLMANLTRNGKITPTMLILLGRPESTRLLDGMSPRITWTLYASNGLVTSYEHFKPPFLLAIDQVLGKIRNEKYRFNANGASLFPFWRGAMPLKQPFLPDQLT